jgi:Flp pilus assembly secretin CpaC
MKTQIDAKLGEPIFLSGLLHEATRNQVKGIPFLKDIPILGGLFSSEDYQENRSELIAILLPSLELPTPPMERFSSLTPKGPIPIPRNQMSPQYESALRSSPDFPWSALE